MSALIIKFPRTAGGARLLLDMKAMTGLRHQYPDGSMLSEIDWDEVFSDIERYVDDCLAEVGSK